MAETEKTKGFCDGTLLKGLLTGVVHLEDRENDTLHALITATENREALQKCFPTGQITDEMWDNSQIVRQKAQKLLEQ
ncbi:MAG: hypothetical protein V1928_04490 [Parcubacteria group bacterium]